MQHENKTAVYNIIGGAENCTDSSQVIRQQHLDLVSWCAMVASAMLHGDLLASLADPLLGQLDDPKRVHAASIDTAPSTPRFPGLAG